MFENVKLLFSMERRVRGNSHARCGAGEKLEITSKAYLSQSGAKSQGIKQLMAGVGIGILGGVAPGLLSGLF